MFCRLALPVFMDIRCSYQFLMKPILPAAIQVRFKKSRRELEAERFPFVTIGTVSSSSLKKPPVKESKTQVVSEELKMSLKSLRNASHKRRKDSDTVESDLTVACNHLGYSKANLNERSVILLENISELLETGLTIGEITIIFMKEARVLFLPTNTLKDRLNILKRNGFIVAKERFILTNPGVMLSKLEETLEDKIEMISRLNTKPPFRQKDIVDLFSKCPDIMQFSTADQLKLKINFLAKRLQLDGYDLGLFIYKLPAILTFSLKAMEEKVDFCENVMRVDPHILMNCPRVFTCSLKRLEERFEFLKQCQLINFNEELPAKSLHKIAAYSNKDFAEKLTGKPLDDFVKFTQHFH